MLCCAPFREKKMYTFLTSGGRVHCVVTSTDVFGNNYVKIASPQPDNCFISAGITLELLLISFWSLLTLMHRKFGNDQMSR